MRGAGRVGPPATRCRLCVLRQIGDQLVPGLEQFLLVDDVVAVEDGAGLVAGQEHGDALGDVRITWDEITRTTSLAAEVNQIRRTPA